jgi:hypothetical protein
MNWDLRVAIELAIALAMTCGDSTTYAHHRPETAGATSWLCRQRQNIPQRA